MATPTVYVICDNNCKFESMTKEQIYTAIMQAVETGKISDINTGFVSTIKTITNQPLRFFVGTQAQYNGLAEAAKENLFAIITDDTTKEGIINLLNDLIARATSLENRATALEGKADKLEPAVSTLQTEMRTANANIDDLSENALMGGCIYKGETKTEGGYTVITRDFAKGSLMLLHGDVGEFKYAVGGKITGLGYKGAYGDVLETPYINGSYKYAIAGEWLVIGRFSNTEAIYISTNEGHKRTTYPYYLIQRI